MENEYSYSFGEIMEDNERKLYDQRASENFRRARIVKLFEERCNQPEAIAKRGFRRMYLTRFISDSLFEHDTQKLDPDEIIELVRKNPKLVKYLND